MYSDDVPLYERGGQIEGVLQRGRENFGKERDLHGSIERFSTKDLHESYQREGRVSVFPTILSGRGFPYYGNIRVSSIQK